MNVNDSTVVGPGGPQARGPSENDTGEVYRNLKYRPGLVPSALATWLVIYFAPGILIGQNTAAWLGLLWMFFGAVPMAAFVWRCLFPERLVAGRDQMRIERPDRKRAGTVVAVGYGKIHEASWEHMRVFWRRLFGPLVFLEPLWPMQPGGGMRLRITYSGPHIILRSDEIERLDEFVEFLRKRGVMGLGRQGAARAPRFISQGR